MSKLERGKFIHDVLEGYDYNWSAWERRKFFEEQCKDVIGKGTIDRIVNRVGLVASKVNGRRVEKEVGYVRSYKRHKVVSRSDLLVFDDKNKKISIVDYKTGDRFISAEGNYQLKATAWVLQGCYPEYAFVGVMVNLCCDGGWLDRYDISEEDLVGVSNKLASSVPCRETIRVSKFMEDISCVKEDVLVHTEIKKDGRGICWWVILLSVLCAIFFILEVVYR